MLRWLKRKLVPIRTRLLVINLVVVMVPVVGLLWARTFERESLRALENDMRHQAEMLRTILQKNLDDKGKPQVELVARALNLGAKRTRMRIRLLDRKGVVLADSHEKGPPEGPEPRVPSLWGSADGSQKWEHGKSTDPGPLIDRLEIRAAQRGELGTATRIYRKAQRAYLFVAMPVMVERRVKGIVYVTRSTVPVLQSMYRLRSNLIKILFVALGLTALLSLFMAATISRPLGRLTQRAKRIAKGDRSMSLRLDRRDEIGELARVIDSLVQQLAQRAQYVAQFAANISHEFKTPLTAISGAAELLLDGAHEDPAARRRFLQNIQNDTKRMDRLVSRILELSRIEAEVEHNQGFDLCELVHDVAQQFGERIQVESQLEQCPMLGHRGHLRSAVVAMVENAVRFSPQDQPVRIELAERAGAEVELRVVDQGQGISVENRAKIFDRFFTTDAKGGGTGLGLAIAATVVRAHGGRIEVHSVEGQGSTFVVKLKGA